MEKGREEEERGREEEERGREGGRASWRRRRRRMHSMKVAASW